MEVAVQVIIKGRNVELTPALKSHVEEKIGKIDRYFDQGTKIEVELGVEKNPSIADNRTVEITVYVNHHTVIRAKQSTPDMYASVDKIIDKLNKRLKKYKEKEDRKHNKHHKETIRVYGYAAPDGFAEEIEEGDGEFAFDDSRIVKTKQFSIKPMTPEEAAMEMELLGHSFFFFTNADTEDPNVLYKRKDGHYGLIEPR